MTDFCYKLYSMLGYNYNLISTLIKSGGGNGPFETQQPPQGKVLISAAAVLKDKKEANEFYELFSY